MYLDVFKVSATLAGLRFQNCFDLWQDEAAALDSHQSAWSLSQFVVCDTTGARCLGGLAGVQVRLRHLTVLRSVTVRGFGWECGRKRHDLQSDLQTPAGAAGCTALSQSVVPGGLLGHVVCPMMGGVLRECCPEVYTVAVVLPRETRPQPRRVSEPCAQTLRSAYRRAGRRRGARTVVPRELGGRGGRKDFPLFPFIDGR